MQRSGAAQEPAGRCTVLVADTRTCGPHLAALLDSTESARADALVLPADRERFVVGAALLRLALARELDVAPADVRIDRTCDRCGRPHGKPRAPGTGVHVSVSHSQTAVLVALTSAAPVGVDVEARGRRLAPGIERLVLAPSEEASAPGALLTSWCRKESVVKATGDGILVPLREVVTSPVGVPPHLISYRGRAIEATLVDLGLGPDFVGAVTVLTDEPVAVAVTPAAALLGGSSRQ